MSKNKYSREFKSFVCGQEKNKKILTIIYLIGHEKMLQSQLIEWMLLFGFYESERSCHRAIKDLEDYQIIKKIATATNNKFIVLAKYGRAYVRNIPVDSVSAHTSSMRSATQNDHILKMRMCLEYAKEEKKIFCEENDELTKSALNNQFFKRFFSRLGKWYSGFVIKENETITFYESILKAFPEVVHADNLNLLINGKQHDHMVTLRSLLKRNIFLKNTTIISDLNNEYGNHKRLNFQFYVLDANNRYTFKKMQENIEAIHQFFKDIFLYKTKNVALEIEYVCTNPEHFAKIEKALNSRDWDAKAKKYVGQPKIKSLDPSETIHDANIYQTLKFSCIDLK